MRLRWVMWTLGLLLAGPVTLAQAGQIKVAVTELQSLGGMEQSQIDTLSSSLAGQIALMGSYRVLDKNAIGQALSQAGKGDLVNCRATNCVKDLGKALKVRWIVTGSLMRFGGTFVLKMAILDARKKRVVASISNQVRGGQDELDKVLRSAATNLFVAAKKKIHPKPTVNTAAARKKAARTKAGVAEFESLMKSAETSKVEQERRDKAWKIVVGMADDATLPVEVRRHAVSKFLKRFRSHNPYRKQAIEYLNALEPATLVIQTQPTGAALTINGTTVGEAPLSREVPAGKYRVLASKQGYEQSVQELHVSKGQSAVVSLLLTRRVVTSPYSTWGHATFWGGTGLAAFGVLSMGLSVKYANDYESGTLSAEGKSNTWSNLMFVGLGAGAVLMTTGVILWLVEPPLEERLEPTHAGGLAPTADGQGLVFSYGGRF